MITITKSALRLLHINYILCRYGLGEYIFSPSWLWPLRWLSRLNPFQLIYRKTNKSIRVRLALEKLGPIFVKFGQVLSTRRDLLPDDLSEELAKLQDQVPSFPGKKAIHLVEQAFNLPIDKLYKEFDPTPLASASIAQVHPATLQDGTRVVVKILRPNIKKIINNDTSLLYLVAKLLEKYWSQGKRLRLTAIVNEFKETLHNELDLLREAANASQLKRNFNNSPLLYIPTVYWPLCKTTVMTIERIDAIPIDDIKELQKHHIDLKILAERGVEIFFTQFLRDNFFHADMHPGNIFVSRKNPLSPQYIGIDFGIMGSLSESDKRYLAENFLAFFNQDYERVAKLHIESGWVPSDTRVDQFSGAIRAVCEPVFQRPLKDISFGQILVRLFKIAGQFQMPIQPQLSLLQKTLLNVEGLGRQLYPDLDLWQTAKPLIEAWIKKQIGPRAFFKRMREYAPYWVEKIPELPTLFNELTKQKKNEKAIPVFFLKPSFFFGAAFSFLFSAILLTIFTFSWKLELTLLMLAFATLIVSMRGQRLE